VVQTDFGNFDTVPQSGGHHSSQPGERAGLDCVNLRMSRSSASGQSWLGQPDNAGGPLRAAGQAVLVRCPRWACGGGSGGGGGGGPWWHGAALAVEEVVAWGRRERRCQRSQHRSQIRLNFSVQALNLFNDINYGNRQAPDSNPQYQHRLYGPGSR